MTETRRCIVIPAIKKNAVIPDQLVKRLAGVTLIQRAIDTARGVVPAHDVVVVTDSQEISLICERNGVRVHYNAGLRFTSLDIITEMKSILRELGNDYGHIIIYRASCPLLTWVDIDDAYKTFLENEADCLVTVKSVRHRIWEVHQGRLESFMSEDESELVVESKALEIDQQEEENNDHGDRQALHQRVHRLEIQLLGSTVLVRHALGQGRDNTAFHDSLDPFLHSVLVGPPGYLGEDAQGTHAVATDDLPLIPASLDRGDLPERDAHAGDDGGKILVADLIERVTLPFLIGSQLDRQSVIAFPEGANRETVVTDRQIGRGHRLRDPEAGGFHWVQSNPYVGQGLLVIGVYPDQAVHLTQHGHQGIPSLLQPGDIVSHETDL